MPNVYVFRANESLAYDFIEPFCLGFVAVAAPKFRGGQAPDFEDTFKTRVRMILNVGLAQGHDALVLSAFGCGAFHNPPALVAKLFQVCLILKLKDVILSDTGLYGNYRKVVFAILDDHNSYQLHNPDGNYAPFVARFGQRLE